MENSKIKIDLDKRLKHLDKIEIENLINRYYNGEKAKKLVEEYQIDVSYSRLYTIFPPIISDDQICPNCQIPMIIKRKSRSSYNPNKGMARCQKCGHTDDIFCNCDYCYEKKRKAQLEAQKKARIKIKKKKELINRAYNMDEHIKVKMENLSFQQKVYLGSLLRLALSEDMETICPLNSIERNLAPTTNFSSEIISELADNKIIVVNPQSPIEAFVESPEDSEFPNVYYIYDVIYSCNIDANDNYIESISTIINPPEIRDIDKNEALLLWKKIALDECLEYLYDQMNKVNFNFNAGSKTVMVLEDLLKHFSVSQIFGIIYKSIANATKWYQESRISKAHAANSVIGNCQRLGEKAIANNWDLNKYNRISSCPQSMISEFFFNRVLRIESLGFHMPPTSL